MVKYDYWYKGLITTDSIPEGIRLYDYNPSDIIPYLNEVDTVIFQGSGGIQIPTNLSCSKLEIHGYNINVDLLLPDTVRTLILQDCRINKFNVKGYCEHIRLLNCNIGHVIIPVNLITLHIKGNCSIISGPWPQDKLILDIPTAQIIPYHTNYVCRHLFVSYNMINIMCPDMTVFHKHDSITIIPDNNNDYKPLWPLNGSFLESPQSDWLWPYAFGPLYQQGTQVFDNSVELLQGKNIIQVVEHLDHKYHFYDAHYIIIPIIWSTEYLNNINCPCPNWVFDHQAQYIFFGHWMIDPDYKIMVRFIISMK